MSRYDDRSSAPRRQLHAKRQRDYDGGMRRRDRPGEWRVNSRGEFIYPAYVWGDWTGRLSIFGSKEIMIAHIRQKVWGGPDVAEALRRVMDALS